MASIKQITEFAELTLLLDSMVKSQVNFDRRFPTDMTEVEIAGWLIELYGAGCLFFAEQYPDGELKFFSVIEAKSKTATWHILFSHPRFKYKTKTVLNEIKDELRAKGVTTILSRTRRVTPSYKRFMSSIESYPFEIVYKCKL